MGTAILEGFVFSALTIAHVAHDHWWVLVLLAVIGVAVTFITPAAMLG